VGKRSLYGDSIGKAQRSTSTGIVPCQISNRHRGQKKHGSGEKVGGLQKEKREIFPGEKKPNRAYRIVEKNVEGRKKSSPLEKKEQRLLK